MENILTFEGCVTVEFNDEKQEVYFSQYGEFIYRMGFNELAEVFDNILKSERYMEQFKDGKGALTTPSPSREEN